MEAQFSIAAHPLVRNKNRILQNLIGPEALSPNPQFLTSTARAEFSHLMSIAGLLIEERFDEVAAHTIPFSEHRGFRDGKLVSSKRGKCMAHKRERAARTHEFVSRF